MGTLHCPDVLCRLLVSVAILTVASTAWGQKSGQPTVPIAPGQPGFPGAPGTPGRPAPGPPIPGAPARQQMAPRPFVIVGGWSNCPADFTTTPLVAALRQQRGVSRVLLTTHQDPWGDINVNAIFEARQIVTFMDNLRRTGQLQPGDDSFDLLGFSMGGLVVRTIVLKFPQELGPYRVANLVTMATPNHGANPVLTNIDPGVGLRNPGRGQNACDPGRAPVTYHGTAASGQMAPGSPLLAELNGQQIPKEIRVTTITGQMFADTPPQPGAPVPGRVENAYCNSNCATVLPPIPVLPGWQFPQPPGGVLKYVDQWQGQCEQKTGASEQGTGFCKHDTVCAPGAARFPDGGVWRCKYPDTAGAPTVAPQRIGLASDGFIRIVSVQLSAREAASIIGQHVVDGIYHTAGTREDVMQGAPVPKPLVDARGVAPSDTGRPILATALFSPWFFDHPRVQEVLLALGR